MRLRITGLLAILVLLGWGCSKEQLSGPAPETQQNPLSKAEINDIVKKQILKQNDVFRWDHADDLLLWSAVVQSDSIVAIGYQPVGETNVKDKIHEINIQAPAWIKAKNDLLSLILGEMNRVSPGKGLQLEDLLPFGEENFFPIIQIKLYDQGLISRLRKMPEVRYLEPMGYDPEEVTTRSDAGCGITTANNIPSADYTTVSPSVKVPWNFNNANIPNAWNTTTGDGIGVAMIDTGTSPTQSKLGSEFNSGQSQGRVIDRRGTYVSSWWWWASPDGPDDQCGHGTQMAGLIAAPRGFGGSAVGVAYNADLLAYRATGDVVINGSNEKKGVRDALKGAGDAGNVKVISMSIGDIFWSNTVADGVYYAYNRGKLLMAAAGTSTSWTNWYGVIFPATMNETVAVTGVKENTTYQRCNTCHSGSKVDFVAIMQRSNDNSRTALTLDMSGNQPSYVSGSSAATAITAGIAALAWSVDPAQTRSQVLQRLKDASDLYPARDGQYGWGAINAADAVK